MILESIAIVLVGLLNVYLGFLVLLRNPKKSLNIIFSLIEFAFACWVFSLFFYQFPIIGTSLFWIYATYIFVTIFSSFILIFSFVFPYTFFPKTFKLAIGVCIIYFLFSLWLLFLTPWWVQGVVTTKSEGLQTLLGSGYIWWSVATWVPFGWAAIIFMYKSKNTKNAIEKIQMQYLWIAFILFGLCVCIPDVIIPLVWHDTRYFFVGALSNLVFSGIIAYLILKHRFLDIRRIIVRTVSKIVIAMALGIVYFSIAYLVGKLFFPQFVNVFYFIIVISASLGVRMLIAPSEFLLEKKIQKMIDKSAYEREDVLNGISRIISITTNFKNLMHKITGQISDIMPHSQASILFTNPEKKQLHFYFPKEEIVSAAPKEYYEIESFVKNRIIITDEMSNGVVRKYFENRKVGLVAPLAVKGELFGYLVLYKKFADAIYSEFDIKTIEFIIPQISVALQNALHIEEIENFNRSLKKEVKNATEGLTLANKKLIQLSKEKDDFMSMASHELRTPTTVIKTFLWILLKKEKSLPIHIRERVEKLYNLSSHLGEMIKELLDISMIESGKMQYHPEAFNVTALSKEILDGVKSTISGEKKITLKKGISVNVYADKSKVHQVITNLITNAIKYTKANGAITVNFEKDGQIVTGSIADNGMGIAKEHVNKLFTKFGKVPKKNPEDEEIPGSGLGLFISKKIIEQSGGKMWVVSQVGKGSTFFFTLPTK